jgi:hypothetical protein
MEQATAVCSLFQRLWSWAVVAWLMPIVYGFGLTAMSLHQYRLAIVFYFIALAYLTAKASTEVSSSAARIPIVLAGLLLLAASFLWVGWTRYQHEAIHAAVTTPAGAPAPDQDTLTDYLSRLVGRQRPKLVQESDRLAGPEGTFVFTFIARQVEGRRIFGGERPLIRLSANDPATSSLTIYIETINDANYLTFHAVTANNQRYNTKYSIGDWKDGGQYHIAASWRPGGEVRHYVGGRMVGLTVADGPLFKGGRATLMVF